MKYHVPDFNMVDLGTVDVILITNFYNMLALPYVTEYSDFKGKIFATVPTVHIGKQIMEELVEYNGSTARKDRPQWKKAELLAALPPHFAQNLKDAVKWRSLYSKKDIHSCIQKITQVNYNQHVVFESVLHLLTLAGHLSQDASYSLQ